MAGRKPTRKNDLTPKGILAATAPKSLVETLEKAAKPPKAAKTPKAPEVLLDYPQEGESVAPGHYAIRVAAKPEVKVEVCIDGGEWLPCREASGYYWFDWSPEAGEHTLVARATNGSPRAKRSGERRVVVA